MKFSLCYTSRRAGVIRSVLEQWLSRACYPENVEIILGIDADYAEGLDVAASLTFLLPVPPGGFEKGGPHWPPPCRPTVAVNHGPKNCVAGWNAAAERATGDVLIAIADDFSPPDGWDKELIAVAPDGWWDEDRAVWVGDGYSPDLMTLAILTRCRYARFGYLFYPGYTSLFSDTEFTYVAQQEQVVINARHLLFEHLHPDCGKRARDAVDLTHASKQRWQQGEQLFNFRKDCGFPLDAGPVAEKLDASYADMKFAVYVQAIRDDFCLYEVLDRILVEAKGRVPAVFIMSPAEYWSGGPQTEANLLELINIRSRLDAAWPGVSIQLRPQDVWSHRKAGRSRIMVETEVRNAAIRAIRREGFEHILVLDGDELWQPGLLDRLETFVREHRPRSVFTGMVPVIGLPGYPVEKALDKATIYIGPSAWFTECRGVSGFRHELLSHDVMHFTATRRTREEIVAKIMGSGHGDDPKYAMAEWCEKVLPNIRPGFRHAFSPTSVGLHMYLDYNVWPSCRPWTQEEWSQLPASVKPYLVAP